MLLVLGDPIEAREVLATAASGAAIVPRNQFTRLVSVAFACALVLEAPTAPRLAGARGVEPAEGVRASKAG